MGTGKPSPAERVVVPHHLLDICEPTETFSAHHFATRARGLVEEIQGRGRLPILVGGTGLYLRAFLKGSLAGAAGDPSIRMTLRQEAEAVGARVLHERLRTLDPATADRIHPSDLFRIVRALELLEVTGRRPSEIRSGLWERPRVAVSVMLVLSREREELYRMIDERARQMWNRGLVDEVQNLLAAGFAPDLRTFGSLGYRQALAFLQGRLTEAEALAAMQRATRQYARRQLTWFRREPAAEWVMVHGWDWVEPLADRIVERLRARKDATGSSAAKLRMSNVEC